MPFAVERHAQLELGARRRRSSARVDRGRHERDRAEALGGSTTSRWRGATSGAARANESLTAAIASSAVRSPTSTPPIVTPVAIVGGAVVVVPWSCRSSWAATTPADRPPAAAEAEHEQQRRPTRPHPAESTSPEDSRIVRDHAVDADRVEPGQQRARRPPSRRAPARRARGSGRTAASLTTPKCSIAAARARTRRAARRSAAGSPGLQHAPRSRRRPAAGKTVACVKPGAVLRDRSAPAAPPARAGAARWSLGRRKELTTVRSTRPCRRSASGHRPAPRRCAFRSRWTPAPGAGAGTRAPRRASADPPSPDGPVVREHQRPAHLVHVELDQVAAELDREPRATRSCSRARAPPRRDGRSAACRPSRRQRSITRASRTTIAQSSASSPPKARQSSTSSASASSWAGQPGVAWRATSSSRCSP